MSFLDVSATHEATKDAEFPHEVEIDYYIDPRTIDDIVYGAFKYRKHFGDFDIGSQKFKNRYVYSFKQEAGARRFKDGWTPKDAS